MARNSSACRAQSRPNAATKAPDVDREIWRRRQAPPKEGRAERRQRRAAEALNDVHGGRRHRQVLARHRRIARGDRRNADGADANAANEEARRQHGDDEAVLGQKDERQSSGQRQQRAARGELADAEPLRETAHERIGAHHAEPERRQQPAGLAWRQAAGADQIDRNQHLAGEGDAVDHEHGGDRSGERLALEQPKVDQRGVALGPRGAVEQREQDDGDGQGRDADPLAQMVRTIEEQHQPRRQQGQPEQVEAARPRLLPIVGQERRRQRQRQDADRQVDEEKPAPGRELEDGAGDDGTEQRREQDRQRGDADHLRHLPAGRAGDHHLRHRREQSAAHALEDAEGNQRIRRPRQPAQGRREGEGREAPEIEGLGADAIDEPAVQRQHQRQRQQIAARHPLDRRKADVQIGGKAGERHVDDRGVELRHEGADGRDADHFPNAGREPIGLTSYRLGDGLTRDRAGRRSRGQTRFRPVAEISG